VLVPFLINIVRSDTIDYALKQSANATFSTVVANRPKLVGKKQLVAPCLEAFVDIIAKSRGSAAGSIFSFIDDEKRIKDGEDDDDEDEEDMSKLAQSSINTMALNLPAKYFVQTALSICSQCISSPDPHVRKAGCAVLGIIIEGCYDAIRPLLSDIVPRLATLYSDPDVSVRECTSFAIGQLAEHTKPDILHYYPQLMPVIFAGLDDPSDNVKGTTCYVVEMFVEHLDPPVIRPYLATLVHKLVGIMQSTAKVSKEILLASIASTAVAAEKDFVPYLEGTVSILNTFLFISDKNQFDIRGRALECLGHLSVAVGEEHFRPYFDLGMRSVMQATQIDDESLKEYGYIYIANIARCMTHLFANYLPTLVPHLIEVITEDELSPYVDSDDDDEEGKGANNVQVAATNNGSTDHDDDDDEGDMILNVAEGFVNTKKAALTAIGSLAEYGKEQYAAYLEMSLTAILDKDRGSFTSLHEAIRAESVLILHFFVEVAKAATPELKDVKPVKGVVMNIVPGSPMAVVLQNVMIAYVKSITVDEDKEAVSYSLDGIVAVLALVGQAVLMIPCDIGDENKMYSSRKITPYTGLMADVIMRIIFEILSEKLPCQQSVEDEQEEEEDEHSSDVMDSVADLIAALPKYILPSVFIPYFDEFSKVLMKYAKPTRDYNSRAMVIGIYAEVIAEVGVESAKYVEAILPVVSQGITDPMEGVRRNSAYAVSCIIQSHAASMSQEQVTMFLFMLQPLCSRNNGTGHESHVVGADVDNAISAICRMISLVPQYLPLQQVLPVLLDALPMRVDPEEGIPIYSCLLSLITGMEATAMSLLPSMLHLFGTTLLSESKAVNDKVKELIRSSLKTFSQPTSPIAPYLANAIPQLPDASIVNALQQAIAS
jgi:importin-4